jgi:hypothetical protein
VCVRVCAWKGLCCVCVCVHGGMKLAALPARLSRWQVVCCAEKLRLCVCVWQGLRDPRAVLHMGLVDDTPLHGGTCHIHTCITQPHQPERAVSPPPLPFLTASLLSLLLLHPRRAVHTPALPHGGSKCIQSRLSAPPSVAGPAQRGAHHAAPPPLYVPAGVFLLCICVRAWRRSTHPPLPDHTHLAPLGRESHSLVRHVHVLCASHSLRPLPAVGNLPANQEGFRALLYELDRCANEAFGEVPVRDTHTPSHPHARASTRIMHASHRPPP